ncbi:MAG TPA: hypothetical protein VFZ09_16565 [Archangium sp.]|uniref:hypothetical protein n=1 Tax=Archangium sp. TaxID=1872627 RepID=UPI002E35BF3E|nr:hypothetical protein [Archangium sp.]HEX5747859.1 hypothetical protein [Archangium sp.]
MVRVSASSKRRFMEVARTLEQTLVASFDDSFETLESRFKALERQLLRSVVMTAYERQEVQRRIAEAIFTEAYGHDCPWPIFGRTLRRIHRLGYSNVERRYHVACLYARWCQRHPQHDNREARRMLDETERSIRRLPHGNSLRKWLLSALSELRVQTGFQSGAPLIQ